MVIDLSMTQSEDDLDLSTARGRRRPKRPSAPREEVQVKRTRRTSQKQNADLSTTDQIVAKTVVSFPKDGPVHAISSLETFPGVKVTQSQSYAKPSAPPLPTSGMLLQFVV